MKRPWIAFFSQTGSEIVDISKSLKRWPDVIVTNERPARLRTINAEILEQDLLVTTTNKPTEKELLEIIEYYDNPIITLHGWLRIIPPNICENFYVYNGHPGLITDFPELKGKDPQKRAFEDREKYKFIGSVIHKVIPEVDEGEILYESCLLNAYTTEAAVVDACRRISLNIWKQFFTERNK